MYKQEPPFCIHVELTEGCNLMCSFCGINGIRSKAGGYKFLTVEQAEIISKRIHETGWTSRMELGMHGEPTANPNFPEIIGVLKKHNPNNQVTLITNGFGLTEETVTNCFKNGLDIMAVDNYGNTNKNDWLRLLDVSVYDYPNEPEGNPHRRQKKGVKFISLIQDIEGAQKGTHACLTNHCGSGSPKNRSADGKRCAKPFREIGVRWDGNIAVCCNDFRGLFSAGNIFKSPLQDIWMSDRFESARKYLYNGLRVNEPCDGCDALSYRVGCLPDKLGKHSYPLPDESDAKIWREALLEKPLVIVIKRPWEE